ncbi:hypothetical protein Oter_4444 [Opitutus terrae PB90-1]|uniref:Lipoprotein n=1 Tax=Opitutus terrae (strain DSM 11246 / JCM 15787 / PB90-1) TaxID=452637 RepID=B1ZPZ4_OPITP|nr:hypothetical protein Oter_4444 [Opitutus terrae PB90-1]
MRSLCLVLVVSVAGLAGCVSAPLPSESAAVTLERTASQSVAVYPPKLVVKDGRLLLDGWVYRQYGALTTTETHIDVDFLDATGRVLRNEVTHFVPRDLHRGSHKMAHRGHYRLPISAMPAGTATIHVRAHDGDHQS